MPGSFDTLRDRLLRAGVAPVHVRRYLRELSEHYCDLVDEEKDAGRSSAEAETAARARLGDDDALAGCMLAELSLRSWTGRAPWATLVVGPFLLVFLAWLIAMLDVGLAPVLNGRHGDAGLPLVVRGLLELAQFVDPFLIGAGVALLGARQRSRVIWPLLGCAVVAFLGGSLWSGAGFGPHGSQGSSLDLGFKGFDPRNGGSFSLAAWSQCLTPIAFSLAIAGAVYWIARRRSLATA